MTQDKPRCPHCDRPLKDDGTCPEGCTTPALQEIAKYPNRLLCPDFWEWVKGRDR